MDKARLQGLSSGTMVDLLELYESSVNEILKTFTITFTGDVYCNREDITDDMLRKITHASNVLWTAIMSSEINKMMSEASKS